MHCGYHRLMKGAETLVRVFPDCVKDNRATFIFTICSRILLAYLLYTAHIIYMFQYWYSQHCETVMTLFIH